MEAVWVIVVADAVMSLDNVLAVAATAHGDLLLVVFGIGLSLPLVVWGSSLIGALIVRFPWVVWLGGGVLGYVAIEMILDDHALARWVARLPGGVSHLLGLIVALWIAVSGWRLARGRGERSAPHG
jgi:predicted tellurium resistance membrane protein TerC